MIITILAIILFILNIFLIKEYKELRGRKVKASNSDALYKEYGGELVDTPGCNTWYSKGKEEYDKWNLIYNSNFGQLLFLFIIIGFSIIL